jgi:fructokinase
MRYRIGIDLGGTKMEIMVLGPTGEPVLRRRTPTPRLYTEALTTLAALIAECEAEIGSQASIGIGIPGTMSPATGLMRSPNTECLNDQPFDRDFAALMGREIRIANDANCFALSEASDGAATGAKIVFGVILGTGAGAGIVVNGQVLEGRHGIAGEWGHNQLPWITEADLPLRACPCGKSGCIERYVAGPALAYEAERLARSLAAVTNVLDPDVIVLGGGLSNLPHLYTDLPGLMAPYVFSDSFSPNIVQARHGDSSGVRGAAWLWPG